VDDSRRTHAAWGLGTSSAWHVLNPLSMASVVRLGRGEGIWNRPTSSGSRWQTAGSFAVDGQGFVRWGHVGGSADDAGVYAFDEAVQALRGDGEWKARL